MDSKLSPEADQGIDEILNYLVSEFGTNFTSQYFDDYLHIRQVLEKLPFGFPVASEIKKVRKLVFRKRTTIYYRINDTIEILAIIDNRRDFKPEHI